LSQWKGYKLTSVAGADNQTAGHKQRRDAAVSQSYQGTAGSHPVTGNYLHPCHHWSSGRRVRYHLRLRYSSTALNTGNGPNYFWFKGAFT